ncbi:MAG: cohesin domain-containing protein, partial [Bacteroidota bacterium]
MSLCLWAFPSFAQAQALELTLGGGTAGPNNTVVIPLTVTNFTNIATYQGTITFDPAALNYQSAADHLPGIMNTFGAPGQGSIPNNAITFAWYDPALMTTTLSDGDTIMLLTFVVDPNVVTGSTNIQLDGSTTPLGYTDDINAGTLLALGTTTGVLTLDADPPTVLTANIVSDNANDITLATVADEITLTFNTSETPASTPVVNIVEGGAGAVAVMGSGTAYIAKKTVATGGDGLVTFSITIEDIYANSFTQTVTTDGSQVTVDT